jgi:hypothetical protein
MLIIVKLRIYEDYNSCNLICVLDNVIDDFKYDFESAEENIV